VLVVLAVILLHLVCFSSVFGPQPIVSFYCCQLPEHSCPSVTRRWDPNLASSAARIGQSVVTATQGGIQPTNNYAGRRIPLNFSSLVIATRSGHFSEARLRLQRVSSKSQSPCRCTSPDPPSTSSSKGDSTLQLARSIKMLCNSAQTRKVRVTTASGKQRGFQRMSQRPLLAAPHAWAQNTYQLE